MKDETRISALLERAGLACYAAALAPFSHNEVALVAHPTPLDTLALGASRLGGDPDLPPDAPWPDYRWTVAETATWPAYARDELAAAQAAGHVREICNLDGEPLIAMPQAFIAQIRLDELTRLATDIGLPPHGTLWFFASQSTQIAGPLAHANIASAVFYSSAAPSELVRTPPPSMPDTERFAPAALTFEPSVTLDVQQIDAAALGIAAGDARRLEELLRVDWSAPRHACFHGPDVGSAGDMPPPGWTSLLRVGSDHALGMSWGDAAWVDFCIPSAALRAGRWQECRAAVWLG